MSVGNAVLEEIERGSENGDQAQESLHTSGPEPEQEGHKVRNLEKHCSRAWVTGPGFRGSFLDTSLYGSKPPDADTGVSEAARIPKAGRA